MGRDTHLAGGAAGNGRGQAMTTAILLDQLRRRLANVQQRIAAREAVEFGSSDWQAATGALEALRCEKLWLASLIDDIATMAITCEVCE